MLDCAHGWSFGASGDCSSLCFAYYFLDHSLCFLWVWDCFIGVILVVAVISFAPVLLIYGAHGIQQERNLLEGAGVVGRDLIGSLLPWAICPVLMVSPLLSGGAIFELETPECFAIFCCLLALLLCICCLCGAYTRIRKMR